MRRLKKLDGLESEIAKGELIVFAEEDSHTLWGGTIGPVWCRENERTEVPIENVKERQTYYGVMNLHSQELTMSLYEKGQGGNTVDFLNYLQAENKGKKLIILWDNAGYHGSQRCQSLFGSSQPRFGRKRLEDHWPLFCPECASVKSSRRCLAARKKLLAQAFF